MNDFEQFEAFQRCRDLVRAVADLINRGGFSQDIALAAQLRKTMLSIYSNFGEGFERDGNREFAQFVSISKGSVGEIRAQLLYALDLGYLEREKFEFQQQLEERKLDIERQKLGQQKQSLEVERSKIPWTALATCLPLLGVLITVIVGNRTVAAATR